MREIAVVSDVHAAFDSLGAVASTGRAVVVLGDFLNFIDYRTGEGMVAEVLGLEFARRVAHARGIGRNSRDMWMRAIDGYAGDVRQEFERGAERQYLAAAAALGGTEAYVTFGNVDHPPAMRRLLATPVLHGEVVDIDGLRIGLVGGGRRSPFGWPADELAFDEALARLGPVDVLGTHVPPGVPQLYRDVVTGLDEYHADAINDYLTEHRPRLHLFGDVHQPAAVHWRFGATLCHNVGYFRATGRPLVITTDGELC